MKTATETNLIDALSARLPDSLRGFENVAMSRLHKRAAAALDARKLAIQHAISILDAGRTTEPWALDLIADLRAALGQES